MFRGEGIGEVVPVASISEVDKVTRLRSWCDWGSNPNPRSYRNHGCRLGACSYGPAYRASPLSETNFKFCSFLASLPRRKLSISATSKSFVVSHCFTHALLKQFQPRLVGWSVHMRNFQPACRDLATAQARSRLPGQPAFSYEQDQILYGK